MKRLFGYFLQGLLLIAPLAIILYVLYAGFVSIDTWLTQNIGELIGFTIPGLGILVLFIGLTILGILGETAIIKPFVWFFGRFIRKIPLLNLLYTSINDLFSAFVGKEKKFNVPVKVLFNEENQLWKLGFLTKESLEEFGLEDKVAVYFPHSYNFSGELYVVHAKRVEKLDISPSETMKFIVSGGVTKFSTDNNEH